MAEAALAERNAIPPTDAADKEEDLAGFLDKYAPAAMEDTPDVIAGRYRIETHNPLPELSRAFASAYAATDMQGEHLYIYALITANDIPLRPKALEAYQKISHHSLPACLAAEATFASPANERRMVLIMERPRGRRLSEIIRQQGPLAEKAVVTTILGPLCDAIAKLHQHRINHGGINPDTIYFDQTVMLQECISEPSGFSQQHFFEPPERMMALPYGKSKGDLSADVYALGVLAIYLCKGGIPKNANLSADQLMESLLHNGCYHTFMKEMEFSENLSDILRGTLTDNALERWGIEQLKSCIGGKRYNLIPPSVPKDSTRAFTYHEQNYFNQRALAHALAAHWQDAKIDLDAGQLIRWLELNTKDTEISANMENILHATLDRDTVPIKDVELAKALALLDPGGPIRLNELTLNIEGLGTVLAEAFRQNDSRLKQLVVQIIETNLPGSYAAFYEEAQNFEATDTLWKLQQTKLMLTNNSLGLGIERILYHLNPGLPCQTSYLKPYYVTDVASALQVLDLIAREQMRKASLVDKHLAAFLTAKLEMTKVIRVVELGAFPDFSNDNRLIMLKLLAQAQQKIGNPALKGLTVWAADMVRPIVDKLHRKTTREIMHKEIRRAVKSGQLDQIAFVMFKAQIIGEDAHEYHRAKNLCKFHRDKVKFYTDRQKLRLTAREAGRQISVGIAYVVLALTIYLVTKSHL